MKGTVLYSSLILFPAEPPRINGSEHPEEISIVVNNPLELLCLSDGIPTPKITWMKDGRPLPRHDDIHVLRGGEVLRTSSAQVAETQLLQSICQCSQILNIFFL